MRWNPMGNRAAPLSEARHTYNEPDSTDGIEHVPHITRAAHCPDVRRLHGADSLSPVGAQCVDSGSAQSAYTWSGFLFPVRDDEVSCCPLGTRMQRYWFAGLCPHHPHPHYTMCCNYKAAICNLGAPPSYNGHPHGSFPNNCFLRGRVIRRVCWMNQCHESKRCSTYTMPVVMFPNIPLPIRLPPSNLQEAIRVH